MTREEEIKSILLDLKSAESSIIGCAVATKNGLMIASILEEKINLRMLSGMAASIVGPTTKICGLLFKAEKFKINSVETEQGTVVFQDLGFAILIVLTKSDPNIGLILYEMENYSKKIEEAMK
jgi:predicted regulator of Ras-like GTPase activity (Roadblock/LC7/MglB family)